MSKIETKMKKRGFKIGSQELEISLRGTLRQFRSVRIRIDAELFFGQLR